MYSNHVQVTSGSRQMLLADFWVQSEAPLTVSERASVVTAMGWDSNIVHHKTVDIMQIDTAHQGHMTLVEAVITLPSYKLIQLDNGEKCWEDNRWHDYALIDEAITEDQAYNMAVNWALHHGFSESDVIGSIKVTTRYIEKFQLVSHSDDPF